MSDMINVSQCTNLTDRRMLHQYIIKSIPIWKIRQNGATIQTCYIAKTNSNYKSFKLIIFDFLQKYKTIDTISI